MNNSKPVSFSDADLTKGFWLDRYELNKNVSIESVRQRFEETGRNDSLRFEFAEKGRRQHVFFDSDVAKWIEAVAYIMKKDRASMKEHEALIDEMVDRMEEHRRADGYYNGYFLQIEPDKVFTDRDKHELYCAGHLMEAAVAYAEATGKDKFLKIMDKYVDCIIKTFVIDKSAAFVTPGHEEIELALIKMYRYTGDEKYLRLAGFFLTNRGKHEEKRILGSAFYAQDDHDIYGHTEAHGHAVRALYLYSGIADYAKETGDERLLGVVDGLFDDVTTKKMYVTGGVGSTYRNEGFTIPYDLPNDTAYSESCGSIALVLLAMRLRTMKRDAKYGHVIERVMYNSLLSSCSLDGKAFFYVNPLAIALGSRDRTRDLPPERREWQPITQRVEVFDCSCCPPNINRIFAEIADVIAFDDREMLTVEQYVASRLHTRFGGLDIEGEYAVDGKIRISSDDYTAGRISLRVPEWCDAPELVLDGKKVAAKVADGYITLEVGKKFVLAVDFHIRPVFVAADPCVRADAGRVALTFGPVVYCLEGVDNGPHLDRISVKPGAETSAGIYRDFHGLNSIKLDGYIDRGTGALYSPAALTVTEKKKLVFIPYFAFANRGESDMQVWVRRA